MKTFALKRSTPIALALSAAFPFLAIAAPAGRVDFAVGSVNAIAPDGRSRALAKGSEVHSGETINCGDGRAQLRFSDGAQVSLLPGTQYRIDDYAFNGQPDGTEKGVFSLLKGGFRTITGLIGKANKQAYKVNTSTATIGIRGTEFLVLDENGVTVSTGDGLVEVCSKAGCIVLAAGEAAVVAKADGTPVRVFNTGTDSTNNSTETPSVRIDYAASNDGLQAVLPKLESGPGYAMALSAVKVLSSGEPPLNLPATRSSGTASFDGASTLTGFVVTGGEAFSGDQIAGGLTNGTVGWGRWTSGTYDSTDGSYDLYSAHYVVGVPTSTADISALGSQTGTYRLTGATFPTLTSSSGQLLAVATSPITGSLTVNFGMGSGYSYQLGNIAVGGNVFAMTGSGSISGAALVNGSNSVTGGSSASGSVAGFLFGSNASHAGLTYQILQSGNTISGAAAFTQTSLAAGSYGI